MKGLLVLLAMTLSQRLPIGLTTELISMFGPDPLARSALSDLRKHYPQRQQLARELANDSQIAPSRIDEWEWQALRSLNKSLPSDYRLANH